MAWKQAGSLQWNHKHESSDVTDASNDIGKGKGGKLLKGRDSDGKIFTYTPTSEVRDSRELVSKGWVDEQISAIPRVMVVSEKPAYPDPNVVYLVG